MSSPDMYMNFVVRRSSCQDSGCFGARDFADVKTRHTYSETKKYCCGCVSLGIVRKDVEHRNISIYTQEGFSMNLKSVDDIHQEKGACGCYKDEGRREIMFDIIDMKQDARRR